MLKCDNKIHISENKSNLHVEKMIKCDTIVSKEICLEKLEEKSKSGF